MRSSDLNEKLTDAAAESMSNISFTAVTDSRAKKSAHEYANHDD